MTSTRHGYQIAVTSISDTDGDFSWSGSVPAGSDETIRFVLTIPAGVNAVLRNVYYQLNTAGATALSVYIYAQITRSGSSPRRLALVYNTNATVSISYVYAIPLPPNSKIEIVTANGSGTAIFARADAIVDYVYTT